MKFYGTHITHDVGAFPAKYWPVEVSQLTSQFSEIIRHSKTVSHCANPVLHIFEVT